MPQTFTFSTTTAKQDAILLYAATKKGVTVQEYVDAETARIYNRAKNEYEQDENARVAAAYQAANNATQNKVKTDLGVT